MITIYYDVLQDLLTCKVQMFDACMGKVQIRLLSINGRKGATKDQASIKTAINHGSAKNSRQNQLSRGEVVVLITWRLTTLLRDWLAYCINMHMMVGDIVRNKLTNTQVNRNSSVGRHSATNDRYFHTMQSLLHDLSQVNYRELIYASSTTILG